MSTNSRRQFIKRVGLFAAAIPGLVIFSQVMPSAQSYAGVALPAGEKPLPESDAVAQAVGYKMNVKDIDYTKYPQRKKPDMKKAFCKSCALYTSVNAGWGKCSMLTNGLVASEGWCGSWSKKA